jgi:toxin ParE1/3/4
MYAFSQAAAMDVENILERSLLDFGLVQTEQYYSSLEKCLELLAANPSMGTTADDIKAGYHRFPHRSHLIFYKCSGNDIFIIRILHKSMDITEHL